MILRIDRLQTELPPPSDPDPVVGQTGGVEHAHDSGSGGH